MGWSTRLSGRPYPLIAKCHTRTLFRAVSTRLPNCYTQHTVPTKIMDTERPMSFQDYVTATSATARYPAAIDGVPLYAALGLASLSQDVMDAMMAEDPERVKDKLGDVFWFVARMFVDAGLACPALTLVEMDTPNELSDERVGATALMILSGQCCEIVKRWYKYGYRETGDVELLRDKLMHLVAVIISCADLFGTSLDGLARDTLSKLRIAHAN